MPFDYQKYDAQCATMTAEQLLLQHKHYTKLSAGAMTSTAVSALGIIPTLGLSGIGIAASAPAHHNAKKKKLIVEKYLKARGIEASQATQYANALVQNQSQKPWMDQQAMQNHYAGQSSCSRGSPSSPDHIHNHNDNKSEKKSSKKGEMSNQSEQLPPPPPTYDEALTGSSNYDQPQRYGFPPQGQYGPLLPEHTGRGQPQGYGVPQGGYMSPPPAGYGAPHGWGYPQGKYCAPQAGSYPQSAMHYTRSGPDPRHVRFAQ